MTIQLHELSAPLVGLLKNLPAGEEIVIQDGEKPIAKVQSIVLRQLGGEEGVLKMLDGFDDPLPEFAEYQ